MINDSQHEPARQQTAAVIDTSVPNAARVANYLGGSRNNFEVDRRTARNMLVAAPSITEIMPASRGFHWRVVRFLATEAAYCISFRSGYFFQRPG